MTINFYKYQGTGNDFVIMDNRTNIYNSLTVLQIKHICDRHFGIGADGLMLLQLKEGYDFEMLYYNADGQLSTMCGNGGRCMVKFAHQIGINKDKYHFIAIDGEHTAEIETNGKIKLQMKDVDAIEKHGSYYILNTGSPHFVKYANDILNMDVYEKGAAIRYSTDFKKEGINVNFVEILGEESIYVRTYERGVENETLSCGTGVTAAALVSAHNDNGFNCITVNTKGGHLSVEFEKTGADHFKNIWLCGPAEFVFKGNIEL
ncbi:MAG: diaminopimelate epimerase [Chitinophagaceae bacterium]|nr:diaminopimelate epimerase [Chitinophagaceae bacterium]